MSDEKKINEVMEAIDGVRKLAEKSQFTADDREKQEKMNAALDKSEEDNQKLVAANVKLEQVAQEQKERMDGIEAKMLRMPAGGAQDEGKKLESKAYETWVRTGEFTPEERKYLRTDSDAEGGYLASSEITTDITKQIVELTPAMRLARVRTTSKGSITLRKRTSIPTAYRVGQGSQDTQSNSRYAQNIITLNRLTVDVPISTESLSDSDFNMESEITQDSAEGLAKAIGFEFISGDGSSQMEGVLVNGDVENFNTGVSNDITGDSLVEITGELKEGYVGRFLMNRKTLARTRTLKDGQGQYIWQNGLAAGLPSTINGDEYVSAIDMPDIGAGNVSVAYGDFVRGYTIAEQTRISTIRDPFSQSRDGFVLFIMHRRIGGRVTLAESIKKLTCAS